MASPNPLACTRPGASPQTDDAACLRPLGRSSDTRGGHSENLPVRPSSSEGTRRKTTRAASVAAVVAILLGNLACGSNRGQQPDDEDAHLKRGVDLGAQGNLDGAAAEFRSAIRIKPDYADAHHNLGLVMQTQGKLQEASDAYRAAIGIQPDIVEAHVNLGTVLQAQGKPKEASDEFRAAIRIKPDLADAHFNLGNAPAIPGEAGGGERRL